VLYGQLLGLFPVNILHTAVHLAIGFWGLMAWRGAAHPQVFARSLAIHWTMKRIENMAWAKKPRASQNVSADNAISRLWESWLRERNWSVF
jgi:hypothetical protein